MNCNICNTPSTQIFQEKVLGKYEVDYFRCPNCEFIQPEAPFWLEEAYGDAIADMDTGILERNRKFCKVVPVVINRYFNPKARFLDYGAGYGIFVRLMRDRGFDYYWQDIYCENLFAKRYTLDLLPIEDQKFELITAFEVFEHLVNPIEELGKMLKLSDSVLFSTNLVPNDNDLKQNPEKLKNWWYLSQETGQHVALYSEKSLRILGQHFGLNLYTNGYNFHLLTRKKLNPYLFFLLKGIKIAMNLVKGDESKSGFRSDRENYKLQKTK